MPVFQLQRADVPWPEEQPFPKQKLPPVKRLEAKDDDEDGGDAEGAESV